MQRAPYNKSHCNWDPSAQLQMLRSKTFSTWQMLRRRVNMSEGGCGLCWCCSLAHLSLWPVLLLIHLNRHRGSRSQNTWERDWDFCRWQQPSHTHTHRPLPPRRHTLYLRYPWHHHTPSVLQIQHAITCFTPSSSMYVGINILERLNFQIFWMTHVNVRWAIFISFEGDPTPPSPLPGMNPLHDQQI